MSLGDVGLPAASMCTRQQSLLSTDRRVQKLYQAQGAKPRSAISAREGDSLPSCGFWDLRVPHPHPKGQGMHSTCGPRR